MKLTIILFLLISTQFIIANANSSNNSYNVISFLPYMQNYIITGTDTKLEGNQGKIQFSFKAPLMNRFLSTQLFFAYTQLFSLDWHALGTYQSRIPDAYFMPLCFFRTYIYNNHLNYIDFGLQHKSNGTTSGYEISFGNRLFIAAQFSFFDSLNLNIKVWGNTIGKTTAPSDINEYFGRYELRLFYTILKFSDSLNNISIYMMTRPGVNINKIPLELGLEIKSSKDYPSVYIQWWRGYGERLSYYDTYTNSLRFGFIFPFNDFKDS